MSQNNHTGVSPKRRPVNEANVKTRTSKTAATIAFLQSRDTEKKSK